MLFGHSIEYLDLVSLTHMVREIYIQNRYAFKAETDHPKVVDAGANIGLATLFFKQKYPRARIIAFEPEPRAFAALKRNIRVNKLANVAAINKAIAGRRGSAVLRGHHDSLVSSLKDGRGTSTKGRNVETVLLSTYIEEEIDFLKMDVEGMELEVIEELAATGKLQLIRQLVCEYHHHLGDENDALSHLLSALEASGFGYQLLAQIRTPFRRDVFQDILVYAYGKKWLRTTPSERLR